MKRIFTILFVGLSLFLSACNEKVNTNRIYVFSQPGCGHCVNAHEYMSRYYKNYDIKEINIREGANMNYMLRYAKKFKINQQLLGTPFIIMGDKYIMGWGQKQIKEFNQNIKNFKPKKVK